MKGLMMYRFEMFREWLAHKIYPEIDLYIKIARRLGAVAENDRVVDILENADSACSSWAVEQIKIKYIPIEDVFKDLPDDASEGQTSSDAS
jgi:hypothetical protein